MQNTERALLICFCTLMALPLLYICRSADTNTFTSWRWVFSGTGILKAFLFLIPGLLCAYALSRLPLSGRSARVFLLALSSAAVIPLWNVPESIIDAARYFTQAKSLSEYGLVYFIREWGREIHAWTDMPLAPLLYGIVFSWLGEARVYIQALNTVLFSLTVVLTCLIGSRLWDEETGLNAGLLMLGMPYLLTQVPLMLVDVPTMFFLTLSIYAHMNAVEKGRPARILGASVAIFLAMLSKYSTWLMLAVVPLISAVMWKKGSKEIPARTFAVMLLSCVMAGAVIYLRHDLVREQIMVLRTYQLSGLSRWEEGFLSTFLFQTHPFIAAFALCGIYMAIRSRDSRFLIAGFFAAFVALLQIKRIRYVLPLFPLFSLMASYGLRMIPAREGRRFVTLSISASSLVLAWCVYLPFLNSTGMANLKQAGAFLEGLQCKTVEARVLPQRKSSGSTLPALPILDLHTGSRIVSTQEWPRHKDDASTSSMRFTWELKKPRFYEGAGREETCATVIISGDTAPAEGFPGTVLKRFDIVSDVFKYQTVVTILKRD